MISYNSSISACDMAVASVGIECCAFHRCVHWAHCVCVCVPVCRIDLAIHRKRHINIILEWHYLVLLVLRIEGSNKNTFFFFLLFGVAIANWGLWFVVYCMWRIHWSFAKLSTRKGCYRIMLQFSNFDCMWFCTGTNFLIIIHYQSAHQSTRTL